jgi:hypothetical protein
MLRMNWRCTGETLRSVLEVRSTGARSRAPAAASKGTGS